MAGYTSRFFLSLTIPSVFGFLSVLWFLKRKTPTKSVSKAIQVEDSTDSDEFENQFLTIVPMKLINKEDNCDDSASTEMQLKETQTSQSPDANGIQLNGIAKKSKSKMREKTCTFPKDYILNGSDRHHSEEDNGGDLSNGIEALNLDTTHESAKDELLLNAINKTHIDMEITNSSQNGVQINGDADDLTISDIDNPPVQQNGGSAKEMCDTTDVQVCTGETNSVGHENEQTDIPPTVIIDSQQPLTLPVVCAETNGEMLESPGATYCDSVGSYDSGKGGSEIHYDGYQVRPLILVYEFEILQEYVGLLIGRNGRHVRYIKEETNADILIKRHPLSDRKKVCAISGTEEEIHAALKFIRKRFPIETYPTVTLSQIGMPQNPSANLNAENLKLNLPERVVFDVMLSATVNAGHFFLQQPTHPSFHSLVSLNTQMAAVYNEDASAPSLPIVNTGYICVAKLGEGWYRAEIDEVFEDTDECRVKFLDYGGYMVLPRSDLKQIRGDFMCMPFQASECYLGEVTYPDGVTDWSMEATAAFEELAQGQILQGHICGYAENRVPYVKLFKVTGANCITINEEMVCLGHAKSLLPPAL